MKRREFLKTVASVAGVAVTAAKIKPAPLLYDPALLPPVNSPIWQTISPVAYPELKAPVIDASGPTITVADFERLKEIVKKGRKESPNGRTLPVIYERA